MVTEEKHPEPHPRSVPDRPMPSLPAPAIGDTVLYRIHKDDIPSPPEPMAGSDMSISAIVRRRHDIGQEVPAVVTRVNSDGSANLHLLLDGPATHWAEARNEGAEPGTWSRA